jgi:hypothetical protein
MTPWMFLGLAVVVGVGLFIADIAIGRRLRRMAASALADPTPPPHRAPRPTPPPPPTDNSAMVDEDEPTSEYYSFATPVPSYGGRSPLRDRISSGERARLVSMFETALPPSTPRPPSVQLLASCEFAIGDWAGDRARDANVAPPAPKPPELPKVQPDKLGRRVRFDEEAENV